MRTEFVVVLALVAAAAFAQFERDSPIEPSPFTTESSYDSAASSVTPSFASSDSSSSGVVTCGGGFYYDEKQRKCVQCEKLLFCENCTNGYSCTSCISGYNLADGVCKVNCKEKYGEGCTKCSDRKCLECSGEECCRRMSFFWNASVCVDPADVFGKGCLATDGTKCTKCTMKESCGVGSFCVFKDQTCFSCAQAFGESCTNCVASSCLTCGENEVVNVNGYCAKCTSLFGSGCSACSKSGCTTATEGYFILGSKAVECSSVFGNCSKCSTSGCAEDGCASGFVNVDGYCQSCGFIFGEGCETCNKTQCTSCDKYVVNGACVDCSTAFGEGCTQCSAENGCSGTSDGYFYALGFSFSCTLLPGGVCSSRRRDISVPRDAGVPSESITFEYNSNQLVVPCGTMTSNCATCFIDGNQAKCATCTPGNVLVGGSCVPCDTHLPAAGCSECTLSGCSACEDGKNLSISGTCVGDCGLGNVFYPVTKTCVPCGTLFSQCIQCTADACTSCDPPSLVPEGKTECTTCWDTYGHGCYLCNATGCLYCTDDDCCPNGTKLVKVGYNDFTCGTCTSAFGEFCTSCSTTQCTACSDGKVLNPESLQCATCHDVFDGCSECSEANGCTKCESEDWVLTENGCYKSDAPIVKPSSSEQSEEKGTNGGLIAGCIVTALVLAAIICCAIYCFIVDSPKRGTAESSIYEDDSNMVTMSVL